MKKIFLFNIVLFVAGLSYAQTSTENYIQTTNCLDADCVKKIETVQYFDYLGRPKQIINIKSSPTGKDIVAHVEYDALGRQTKSYLPVPQSGTQNGEIYPSPLSNASTHYGGEKIYSESFLENSPLQRIQQQVQVGNDWASKPVNFTYDVNSTADAVKKFTPTTVWENEATTTTFTDSELYANGQLTKNAVKDEDGNETIEFKNGWGQTVLTRKMLNTTQKADTYYIYNEYGSLAYVIPPLASVSSITSTILDNLCYQYKYDSRNNLVEKKLPGKGWEYMLYDKQDRLVASQDANLRAKGQWQYVKYDQFGRVAITGIGTGSERITEQNMVTALGSNNVNRLDTAPFNRQGVDVYYGNQDSTYPNSTKWVTLLSLNYYDIYPNYSFNPAFPSSIIDQTVLTDNPATDGKSTKGLPVISLVKNVEDDNWTKNFNYYDKKGRIIGTYTINHLGGYTKTESELDFAGATKQSKVYHKRLNTDTEKVITQAYTYDNQNRLLVHKHKVDNNTEEILTQNEYNELSQLKNKKVGGTNTVTPLQSIDYVYNIRGWLTKINDPANLNGKLFGYEMRYSNPVNPNIATGKFNGNIAEVDWKTSNDGVLRRYDYQYDTLNRLKKGIYFEPNSSVPGNDFFNESLDYDLNGNISTLQRNQKSINGALAEQIDDLSYNYSGNRLTSVTDGSHNYNGYPDISGNTIAYDNNGNMTNQKDKGILGINYNYLNLPNHLIFDQYYIVRNNGLSTSYNINTKYIYNASGEKLKKIYTYSSGRAQNMAIKSTDYLDGFQYEQTGTSSSILKFIPTAEGYFNFENNKYIYNYKDHLGNTRISFANSDSGVEMIDENNYYPFGLKHEGYNNLTNVNGNLSYNYKYNGKELQETGFYDYGARMYMPDIGRWGVMDAMSEKYRRHSPYNYAVNNPIMFIDPDGNEIMYGLDAQRAFTAYTSTMPISSESSGSSNYFTEFNFNRFNDPPSKSFWGRAIDWLFGSDKKGEITEFGPLEKIPMGEKKDGTWLLISAILFGNADPYSGIGNAGVGPYAEERENVGMAAMLFVNPEAAAEGLERKLLKNTLPVSTEGKLFGSIVNGEIVMDGTVKASGTFDFVITKSGETLLGRKHTFLSKGADVLAAGELKIRGGSIVNINNLSGHYVPGPDIANTYLDIFKSVNINVSKAHLKIYNSQGRIINHILPK